MQGFSLLIINKDSCICYYEFNHSELMNFDKRVATIIVIIMVLGLFTIDTFATVVSEPNDGDISALVETELEVKLENPPNNSVAIQLRLEIQGGQVINFEEDTGFFSGPQCPDTPVNTTFTDTEVCVDLVKGSNLEDGDVLGTLTVTRFSGQTLTINKTDENLYVLDDSSLVEDEAELAIFNEGLTTNTGGSNSNNFSTSDSSVTPTPVVSALPATGIVDDVFGDKLVFGFIVTVMGIIAFTYIYIFSNSNNEEVI